jgi:glycosyltransferase involved in cell wall biosynthesis
MLRFFGTLGKVISFSYFHLNEARLRYLTPLFAKMKESPVTSTLYNTPLYTVHVRQNSCKPMLGETLNAPQSLRSASPAVRTLPRHLLYSIFARIGGSGLDTDAFETLRASYRGGFLGKAIAYDNRQKEIPASLIHSLRWHPVRLISFFDRPYYYGAKKKYLDWIVSRHLATGHYDLFHSWSGDCLRSLRVAKQRGIPSIVEVPTWHRDGGKNKVERRKIAESATTSRGLEKWKARLLLERKRFIEEYQLADLLLVLSERAANTFRVRGFPEEKLFYLPRGVDVERFKPGHRPAKFRAVFAGALIKRKGIQHVLEAWHRLNLPDAELWLVGHVHDEAKPFLKQFWRDNIRVVGFARDPENYLSQGTVHVFPSQWEGSAKVTYEAAACALPQITTREAGDVVRDGVEGIIVKPGNVDAIAAALQHLHRHPEIVQQMGSAARRRVVENFTWDHFRTRLLGAYETAMRMAR